MAAKLFNPLVTRHIGRYDCAKRKHRGCADAAFTVPRTDFKAIKIARRANELGAKAVTSDDKIAKVSLVGVGMKTHSGIASRMFSVLAREGINIMMISTSEIKISCVIDEKFTELAVRALHDEF
jgi:aspartate kinase